jgi:alkanesulfonate monooxygenase SsuD/methylene tetrahydromethanopterin reductase-like flavin-dependent oxidoreductase (luciferase family)
MNFGFLTECYAREGSSHAQAYADAIAQADAAEAMGLDSIWMVEQHFRPWASLLPSPMLLGSAIAARTKRVRIGLAVQVLPLCNPLRVAEEANMLDQISGGRFDLGVGRSGITKFYDGYNIPYAESRERFDEALEIILGVFTTDPFSFEGQFHSYHDVTLSPNPVQSPHPPVWVATSTPESFPVLGKRGIPLLLWFQGNWTEEPLEAYRKAWHEAGHPGEPQVLVRFPAYVGETPDRGFSEPRVSTLHDFRRTLRENREAGQEERANQSQYWIDHYDEYVGSRAAYGSPEEVVERLREFKERMGVTGFMLDLNFGGQIPQELVLNSMRLLAEKVMPEFK